MIPGVSIARRHSDILPVLGQSRTSSLVWHRVSKVFPVSVKRKLLFLQKRSTMKCSCCKKFTHVAMKCVHCEKTFCLEHRLPEIHACPLQKVEKIKLEKVVAEKVQKI